jgi:hypothetical protein
VSLVAALVHHRHGARQRPKDGSAVLPGRDARHRRRRLPLTSNFDQRQFRFPCWCWAGPWTTWQPMLAGNEKTPWRVRMSMTVSRKRVAIFDPNGIWRERENKKEARKANCGNAIQWHKHQDSRHLSRQVEQQVTRGVNSTARYLTCQPPPPPIYVYKSADGSVQQHPPQLPSSSRETIKRAGTFSRR